MSRKLWSHRT